jgi:hypothetical protein
VRRNQLAEQRFSSEQKQCCVRKAAPRVDQAHRLEKRPIPERRKFASPRGCEKSTYALELGLRQILDGSRHGFRGPVDLAARSYDLDLLLGRKWKAFA